MKVFEWLDGELCCIGRADVANEHLLWFEVPLFGRNITHIERYQISGVSSLSRDGGYASELAIILAPGQPAELLPGWQPLAS